MLRMTILNSQMLEGLGRGLSIPRLYKSAIHQLFINATIIMEQNKAKLKLHTN